VNPFAALRTGFQFEYIGIEYAGAPVDAGRQVMKMVLTVIVVLSRHMFSLPRDSAVNDEAKTTAAKGAQYLVLSCMI